MIRRELEVEFPVEAGPLLAHLEAHAIPGCELPDREGGRHTRLVATAGGPRVVTVGITAGVTLETGAAAGSELDEVTAAVRAWLGLEADLDAANAVLREDPRLAPLVAARPGLRVVGYPEGFEGAVMTILGQQVSLAAARTFGGRLAAAFGEPRPGGLKVFPSPARIAAVPVEELRAAVGITAARARTISLIGAEFAGGLRLDPGVDPAAARSRLAAIPGVGPWTVEYLAVRALRDPDAFPSGDLVLRRELGVETAAEAEAIAEAWRPWRAHGLFHVWTAAVFAGS